MASFAVTNLNDTGAGSLRAALEQANANPGLDVITFASGLSGTISLASALPEITGAVTIQGLPAGQSTPVIQIDFAGHAGLVLGSGSNGSSLIGLSLVGASGDALTLVSSSNTIQNNYIGVDLDGLTALANQGNGITITATSRGNLIGSTTPGNSTSFTDLSQEDGYAIASIQGIRYGSTADVPYILCGSATQEGSEQGIGVVSLGAADGSDAWYTVNAATAFAGGSDALTSCYGPEQLGPNTIRVVGSYNSSGAIPPTDTSAFIYTGAIDQANGTTSGFVEYQYPGSTWTFFHSTQAGLVVGNWDDTVTIPDTSKPIIGPGRAFIYDVASGVSIADVAYPGAKSTTAYGIAKVNDDLFAITGSYSLDGEPDGVAHGYLVYYHRGSNSFSDWTSWDVNDTGLGNIASHADGISYNSSDNTFTLATVALDASSGDPLTGQLMTVDRTADGGFGAMRWTEINYPDSSGGSTTPTSVAGDVMTGVFVGSDGSALTWSSETSLFVDPSNLISGNAGHGIAIIGSSTDTGTNNTIAQNRIGTTDDGSTGLANGGNGILIDGASRNLIGGTITGGNDPTKGITTPPPLGNLISGNTLNGVMIIDGASHNTLSGNFIGTSVSGNQKLANGADGVAIIDADDNALLGCQPESSPFVYYNVVSGNTANGLRISNSDNTTIHANFFGLAANNQDPLGNGLNGTLIEGNSGNTQYGGVIPLGNVNSGNGANGIEVKDQATGFITFNTFAGTTAFGGIAPNQGDGMLFTSTGGDNTIRTNVIGGNNGNGIRIAGSATGITVDPNIIGLNSFGTADTYVSSTGEVVSYGNKGDGIRVEGEASAITIAGTYASVIPQNTISNNDGYGIRVTGNASNVQIANAAIGTGSIVGDEALQFGNHLGGVFVGGSADQVTVGDPSGVTQTLLANNSGSGLMIEGSLNNQISQTEFRNNGTYGLSFLGVNAIEADRQSGEGLEFDANADGAVQIAPGWANLSLTKAVDSDRFTLTADSTISVLRLDTGAEGIRFGIENAASGSGLDLAALVAASENSLNLEKILSGTWAETEGVALGGRTASSVAADTWIPVATDASGQRLTLESLVLSGNSASARFAGGVEAVYAVGGSGLLASSIADGPLATVAATVKRLGAFNNGLALYEADALTGAVDGLLPGAEGYLQAALQAAKRGGTLFSDHQLPGYGENGNLNLTLSPEKNYGFLLIVDGDEGNLYSSYSAANPDGSIQITSFTTPDGALTFGFEDLLTSRNTSDQDFNDLIVSLPAKASAPVANPVSFRIGSLFPTRPDGEPNLLLSSNLALKTIDGESRIVNNPGGEDQLDSPMRMSSDPVVIPGLDRFLRNWFIPQITAVDDAQSLFSKYKKSVLDGWKNTPRNNSITDLLKIGYIGPGREHSATNNSFWNGNGDPDEQLYKDASDPANYDPVALWSGYDGSVLVSSAFDQAALLDNIAALENPQENPEPDLWYPSMLYTMAVPEQGTSYPGPVLVMQPGDDLRLRFNNDIRIAGLTEQQNQQATLVVNSTYGNSAGDGLGAATSANYHLHGSHTNPTGFGDNVVARYTSGQQWTTEIDLPLDHGQGAYWYHPHYHPSVNQMVYGGMSGALLIGDPLSKVPLFKDVPRNLAVLKTMDVGIVAGSSDLRLDGFDNLGGVVNRMTMVTVNGEFQPTAQAGRGGWQALTLSNQANQAFYNISLIHTDPQGNRSTLPLYIYGEDGHQYPQIRPADQGVIGVNGGNAPGTVPRGYTQAQDLVSLPPAKRVDLLFYLPEGTTELASTYSFEQEGDQFAVKNAGGYPDLSSANTGFGANTGAGPLALFEVTGGTDQPSEDALNEVIALANHGISVQEITPATAASAYDPRQVPSVDLFAKTNTGEDVWQPIRRRQFNWTKNTLVGPSSEYDAATVALLEQYSEQNNGATYQPYTSLPVGKPGVEDWLGYNQPFLINDHVFPNGNLTIAQLGTMEEWVNRNWSIGSAAKYIGHPFHIHINDYQVKDSDTELQGKRNLEDTTPLNSSGYHYYDSTLGRVVSQDPLRGSFHSIDEALDPQQVGNLATFGANDQTIRMLFQDYLGTYVFHCHILPHEDAGMMQVLTVVENTDSSWLVAAQGFEQVAGGVVLHQAQTYAPITLQAEAPGARSWIRAQAGDLNVDFVQDIALSAGGGAEAGLIQIFDGAALQQGQTLLTSSLTPYSNSMLAPWVFIEDFSGDGQRDLLTAGFDQAQVGAINLKDLEIKSFLPGSEPGSWQEQFNFDPFDDISLMTPHQVMPRMQLTEDQVSVAISDMNLDNFQDVAIAYAVDGGVRLVVLDGAALSLSYQTGEMEGGYFPNSNVLADALLLDSSLSDLSQLVLTSGFNSYAQSALENVVLTTASSAGRQQFTLQLQAGHFIATSLPGVDVGAGGGAHGGHGGQSQPMDDRIVNLRNDSMPVSLVEELQLPSATQAVTPVIGAGLGHGGTLVDGYAVVAQGNAVNGTSANTDILINTSQQLVVPLQGLNEINIDDLTGIIDSTATSTFSADQVRERYQLTAMTYLAYTGQLLWPSALADQAARILGAGGEASALVSNLLTSPGFASEVDTHYGGPLAAQTVESIVETAYTTLFQRSADAAELLGWQSAVANGLERTMLPQSILQSADSDDRYRVATLSGISQWIALQWGTTAAIAGSFGQGLSGDLIVSTELDQMLLSVGTADSWDAAQDEFAAYSAEAMNLLTGTPVSKSGFF